ncbi:MAG: hypothetical protein IIA45_00585 [Bacteroidetes bacterium]|nr:hypothetical protein [Bacteroidota bacterium]
MGKPSVSQQEFFTQIKDLLPSNLALVDEVADVLDLGTDSAYRRIRGEKELSFEEMRTLASRFKLSVDSILNNSTDSVTFQFLGIDEKSYTFENYLTTILVDMKEFDQMGDVEFVFILNELNIFQIMQFPELIAFRMFFWNKSNFGFEGYKDKKFEFMLDGSDSSSKIIPLAREIVKLYTRTPSTEIITDDVVNSYLKQIKYYYEAGYFKEKEQAIVIATKLVELIEHIERQAEEETKFEPGLAPANVNGEFKLYFNDLVLLDHSVLVKTGEGGITYLLNNAINYLASRNQAFFEHNYKWTQNMLKRMTLISGSAEKERRMFFNEVKETVHAFIESLK